MIILINQLKEDYENLLTAPIYMRDKIISFIKNEIKNVKNGGEGKICIKINSLQDKSVINKLYDASNAGVRICLIVRGICCLRPGRKNLSENIKVISIIGDYLEHSRLYYFHNDNDPLVFSGSADVMIRSYKRRIESLFKINDELIKKQAITILNYNIKDNINSYVLQEDGIYKKKKFNKKNKFDLFEEFYSLNSKKINDSLIL